MSYDTLTTMMRNLSSTVSIESETKSFIDAEINKKAELRNDIVLHICNPAKNFYSQIITRWQQYLVGSGQSHDPGAPNFMGDISSGWEYRSVLTNDPSNLTENTYKFGDPFTANSTVDTWTVEKWKIWEKSGSTWNRLDSNDETMISSNDVGDLTLSLLTSLDFNASQDSQGRLAINDKFLYEYTDQWSFGMEWLHARPTTVSGNPYAGSTRTFGVLFTIEQMNTGKTANDTNFNFNAKLADNWNKLLK